MHIAMQAAIVTKQRITLNIVKRAKTAMDTELIIFTNRHTMSCLETVTNNISRIYNRMTTNKRALANDCLWILIMFNIAIIGIQWFTNHTIITNSRVVANFHIIIYNSTIAYANIFSNFSQRTNTHIIARKYI